MPLPIGESEDRPDFDAAEFHLKMAREAYENGDENKCSAAVKLVKVALLIPDVPLHLRSHR